MAKTLFDISFIDNNNLCDQICFTDLSQYNEDVEVKTPVIKVLYPDFVTPVENSYSPRSTNIIRVPPMDGLYTIELSVCPNDKVKQTFYYFKLCAFYKQLGLELCKHSGNKSKVLELTNIWLYTKAIKEIAKTEPTKAVIMFNVIKNQLCS